jgi:hypothetical protein
MFLTRMLTVDIYLCVVSHPKTQWFATITNNNFSQNFQVSENCEPLSSSSGSRLLRKLKSGGHPGWCHPKVGLGLGGAVLLPQLQDWQNGAGC